MTMHQTARFFATTGKRVCRRCRQYVAIKGGKIGASKRHFVCAGCLRPVSA
jgi:transposase-like protein